MEVWLKSSTRRFRLPVIPAEYTVTGERGDETVNVNAIGEVDLGGNRKLRSVSWSCFFPYEYDAGYCQYSGLKSPMASVEIIEEMMHVGPVKLIITGTPVKFWTRISSFEWSERDGSGDVYYSITFREHRPIKVGSSTVTADESLSSGTSAATTTQRTVPETEPITVTVQESGTSASSVARQKTGSASNKNTIKKKDGTPLSKGEQASLTKGMELQMNGYNPLTKYKLTNLQTAGINGTSTVHKSESGTTHGGGTGRRF